MQKTSFILEEDRTIDDATKAMSLKYVASGLKILAGCVLRNKREPPVRQSASGNYFYVTIGFALRSNLGDCIIDWFSSEAVLTWFYRVMNPLTITAHMLQIYNLKPPSQDGIQQQASDFRDWVGCHSADSRCTQAMQWAPRSNQFHDESISSVELRKTLQRTAKVYCDFKHILLDLVTFLRILTKYESNNVNTEE